MLICKNCFTENPVGSVRCQQCNMAGNFEHRDGRQVVMTVEKSPLHCKNCGCSNPGTGEKCVECHFPLAPRKKAPETPEMLQFRNLKIG